MLLMMFNNGNNDVIVVDSMKFSQDSENKVFSRNLAIVNFIIYTFAN